MIEQAVTSTGSEPGLDPLDIIRQERARTLRQRLYGYWFDLSGSVSALAMTARLGW